MAEAALTEPDRVGDLPHPRETTSLYGQATAEAEVLDAWAAGRMPHAWLLTGPRGVGKATLAYRIARKRIAEDPAGGLFGAPAPPESLSVDPDHPVARRIAAGAERGLAMMRRSVNPKTEKLNTAILVGDVRGLKSVFEMTHADGGWRVAVVDPAEEMNAAAANALLKLLEEPPPRSLFLLISHAPRRLLPTIRSRCRTLTLAPLGPDDLAAALADAGVAPEGDMAALALLSGGSAGEAARLAAADGVALYARIVRLMTGAPGMDRGEMIALAEACGGRTAEEVYDLTLRLLDVAIARLARAAAFAPPDAFAAPDEPTLMARLAPDAGAARLWADLAAFVQARALRGRSVNLDPTGVMLDIFFEIDAAARKIRARGA